MLTISKPLSAAQVRTYHAEEFSNARDNYYTQGDEIRGQWHGQLARAVGTLGRRAGGAHPSARRRAPSDHGRAARATTRPPARTPTSTARRVTDHGAPRRMGRDVLRPEERVADRARRRRCPRAPRRIARASRVALDETERYVQARIGGNHPAETTGKWVAARFEHDSARPVDGYAAPQLHTHVVFFNVTERSTGETRALQPQELYKTQQYGDGRLPLGTGRAPDRPGLRDRARDERTAGDSRLLAGVPRRVQSPPPADSGLPREGPAQRRRRRADRGAPDARSEGRRLA